MSRPLVVAPCLLALGAASALAAGPTEAELVAGFLARDAAAQRSALLEAHREAASLARLTAPAWRLEALREESTSRSTAFTTDALGVGVELELGGLNEIERRRAAVALDGHELGQRAALVEAVTELRSHALAAWESSRRAELLRAQHARTEELLAELERLVEAGEHSRFDLERLAAVDTTHEARLRVAAATALADARRLSLLTGVEAAAPELPHREALPPAEELRELVLDSHPRLRRLRRAVEESELGVELAGRSHPARLDLRAGWRRDDAPGIDGGEGYEVEAVYTLAGRSLRRRAEAVALGEQGLRSLRLARAERAVLTELEAAHARLAALHGVERPEGADLDSIRRGSLRRYRSGEAALSELIDVLEELEDREQLMLETEVARREARLDLDRAAGLVTAPELAELVDEVLR